jgi:hypothetical protein
LIYDIGSDAKDSHNGAPPERGRDTSEAGWPFLREAVTQAVLDAAALGGYAAVSIPSSPSLR